MFFSFNPFPSTLISKETLPTFLSLIKAPMLKFSKTTFPLYFALSIFSISDISKSDLTNPRAVFILKSELIKCGETSTFPAKLN